MKTFKFIKCYCLFFLSFLIFVGCTSRDGYKPQTHIVEIKDMMFVPANLNVHKGDTVIWINKDIVAHDVTEAHKAWASPTLASNASFKKTIINNEDYFCSIHLIMTGRVTVEE